MQQIVKLQRNAKKSLSSAKAKTQIQRCADIALKGGRGRGWTYKIGSFHSEGDFVYGISVRFSTTSERKSLEEKLPHIIQRLAEACSAGPFRVSPWRVISPTGYESVAKTAVAEHTKSILRREQAQEPKTLGEVNLIPSGHFDRIYGREAQIRRIIDALELGKRTQWLKRRNSLLDGPPGCGKSECMMAIAKMLGEEGKAWRWFDATSMTKAGAIEEIIESPVVPPVLFLEEIEKCEDIALRWLLGVMDTRGEIRRTNYRVGNQAKHVRMVVIASANNVKVLKGVMSGALYSRFQNKIYFPSPNREILKRIMEREIAEIQGDPAWIKPALEFGYDKWGIDDPRDIINILSCGGKRLLTGEYQKDWEATLHPEEKSDLEKRKDRAKPQDWDSDTR